MRRGLTLLELIFSMVIIAIAFSVLPKILQMSAKVNTSVLKEEALSSEIALIGLLRTLPWDERNTVLDDILYVDNGKSAYECGVRARYYRRGGFVGSRNCLHHLQASAIGMDSDDTVPDDIDDYDGANITASNFNNSRSYLLHLRISYVEDIDPSGMARFSRSPSSGSTNLKLVEINATPVVKKGVLGERIAHLYYYAANIGQLQIKRLPWKK